ncbi:tripartite tricarboxylate transporter TctB family protein [Natronorarus salvus]|uniref:tripartite tricarboxylate transporter TctB family protein n=1 Tax=Natronorarus salvus TaxID=3117733 RepID=UPI002F26CB6E
MSVKERAGEIGASLTMEHALLVVFVGTSIYMFVGAFEFSQDAAIFPWFTTGVVIVFGVLLLLRSVLPEPLRRFVADDVDVFETGTEEYEPDDEDGVGEAADGETGDGEGSVRNGASVTGGLCLGYLVGSYLVGMLWVTPLFVLAYTVWRDRPRYAIVGLTVLSFLIAFVFYSVLNLPVEEGLIQELVL